MYIYLNNAFFSSSEIGIEKSKQTALGFYLPFSGKCALSQLFQLVSKVLKKASSLLTRRHTIYDMCLWKHIARELIIIVAIVLCRRVGANAIK